MPQRVAIFGGGVAGLSAAHELVKRGFEVDVYEACGVVGGKARSLGVPGSGTGGRDDLPAEHGFRFFPGFYKHLPATMKEIQAGSRTAFERLVETEQTLLAREDGKQNITTINKFPTSLPELIKAFEGFTLFYCDLGVPRSEVTHFARKLLMMLVSCDRRRFEVYEGLSWHEFMEADTKSEEFRRYLVKGLSRSLVALNAVDLSSRTGGCILLQFLMDFTGATPLDRVLDLPTNDAWITHWFNQLDADPAVNIHLNAPLLSIQMSGGLVSGASVEIEGAEQTITADHYIAALPVEVMQDKITDDMIEADPHLELIENLEYSWMTGIIFYLKKDVPIVPGHANYLDSNWALTSISQPQFWPEIDLNDYGDGNVQGILSVIISNWSDSLAPKAIDCTDQQVKDITWQQLKDHLNPPGGPDVLEDSDLIEAFTFLAPCLKFDFAASPMWTNAEPLFINTKNSWFDRPEAVTDIDNFYLASDYVRTNTDLATMESANEAARRAVNGILDRSGSFEPRCDIWELDEPGFLKLMREGDEVLYAIGFDPFVPFIPTLPWPCP